MYFTFKRQNGSLTDRFSILICLVSQNDPKLVILELQTKLKTVSSQRVHPTVYYIKFGIIMFLNGSLEKHRPHDEAGRRIEDG